MVVEVVAYFLAPSHPEGYKSIALLPVAQCQGEFYSVEVEAGCILVANDAEAFGIAISGCDAMLCGGVAGTPSGYNSVGCCCGYRLDNEIVAMTYGAMCRR